MPNTLRKFQYILEGIDQEHLTDILVKRLKSRYPDISTKYEEDVLHDAAMDVASFHAGAEELGTSDIGAMIKEVIKNLERFNERGQGEKMIPNSVRGWRMNEETEPERVVRQLKAAKKYLGQDPEPKEPEEKETNESYWGGPSPAQLRFNRALKKQQNSPENKADREKFQKELDRIMPPLKKPEDTEKQVTEKTSPKIFNRPKNAPIFSTKPEKIGNYIFDASEFEGSMVYGKDAKGLIVRAYDPKTMDVIGSASFVLVRKKGKNGDSWLESDDTKVQEKYRGKGIATAMYQYAKNLGNDIKPSPYKSSAGSEMWKAWGRDVFEDDSSPTSGTTDSGYTWKFEAGREVPFKTDVAANTFVRVTDPAGQTVAGVWADVEGDSLVVEYSQVFDEELRGRGLYTDLLKSLSKQYAVTSDTDTNNAAVSIYKRLGADYDAGQAKHTLRKQGVTEGSNNESPNHLVSEFLKSISPKELRYYTIRDNCGPAALHMKDWAKGKGIDLTRHQGYFVADNVVYDKADFTKEMKREFIKQGLDFNDPTARKQFIESNPKYSEEWKKIPHYWLQDKQGNIYDPTGYIQFVKTGLSSDLAKSRYTPIRQGVAEDEHASQPRPRAVGSLKTMVDVGGIQLNVAIDGSEVSIRPIVDGYQAGYVVFDRDGSTLVPADLAIDEQFRGQGIAKTMYDYVKNLGFTIRRSSDQTKDGKHFWDKNRGEDSQVWEQTMTAKELDEACWKGYHKEGNKKMFGKTYPNCVKNTNEDHQECPECGGPMFSEELINEKKDACYYKVKSRYKVWPSAYASGALVKCRKKGADSWGNSTKNESSILEGIEQTDENLHKWFKEKWVRFGPDGKIRGDCARGDDSEGKPKCLPQSKAQNLGKKGRASAAARKRREDPNPERSGKAINVATKKKTSESSILQGISETKGLPMPGSYEQENKPFLRKGGQKLMALTTEQEELDEKWSDKYKRSIDCNNPKGFSQRAHCQGRKKK